MKAISIWGSASFLLIFILLNEHNVDFDNRQIFTRREIARAAAAVLDGGTCAQLYSTNVNSIAYFARVWMVASTWPAFEFLRRKWRGKGLPRSNLNTAIMSCSIVRICACEYALSVMYTKSPFLNLDRKYLLEKKHVKYGTFSIF